MSLQQVLDYIDSRPKEHIAALADLVRIPSVSAGAGNADAATPEIRRAAEHLAALLRHLGLHAETISVSDDTHPLVLGNLSSPQPDRPTVLIYGHYDVQGVDNPRSAWSYDPFAAECRDGYLLGRGASDNKGQLMAHLKALEALVATGAEWPVNPVFLIEGEEECGSRALGQFIAADGLDPYAPFLCTVVSDSSMYAPERPSLTIGLRGIVFTKLTLSGPRQDLHSGLFGGIVPNPNNILVRALASLTDASGRVTLPGFYNDVQPVDERERSHYLQLPVDEDSLRRTLGVQHLQREPGYTLLEQRWTRPTLDVHFLSGGSPRTVIPASSTAALSFRLVPDQQPDAIVQSLQDHLQRQVPSGYRLAFTDTHACPAYHLDMDHPLVAPALEAIRNGFQIEPVLTREGGSIPVVVDIAAATGAPVLLVGFGQLSDNWHGPDERFSLRDYHRGIRTAAALMYSLGACR